MYKPKCKFNLTVSGNLRHSFESSVHSTIQNAKHRTLSLETKIRNLSFAHHKSHSLTKNTTKPKKKLITFSTTKNIFQNVPNYIPLPNGNYKKSWINSNFSKINLSQSNSVKMMAQNRNKKYNNSISLTASCSSSNILKKESPKRLNTESTTQSTDDNRILIDRLQKDNLFYKEKLSTQKKNYESKIKELNEEIFNINEKNKNLMKKYTTIKEENDNYQIKEMKLMKIIYLIKKQGMEIDDIINDVMNDNQQTNRSEISLTSITFPDKVKVPEPTVIKGESFVPFLELNRLPSYESEEEDDDSPPQPKKNNFFLKK